MRGHRKSLLPLILFFLSAAAPGQILTEFAVPEGVRPGEIVLGPDGALWFTDFGFFASRVGRITAAGDVELLSSGARDGFSAVSITTGSDGNLWLTYMDLSDFGRIVRLRPSGEHVEFAPVGGPTRVTNGPDGNLWFTQVGGGIGRMTPAADVTVFQLPRGGATADITTGPDGNLWFTYHEQPFVGRITPAGDATVFPVPVRPRRIASGPDGNLWVTADGNRLLRMTTGGSATEFAIPGSAFNIIAGPDGNIWFPYTDDNRIGRITTDGTLLLPSIAIPAPSWDLAIGSDGNVWFTLQDGRIGRIELTRAPAIETRILPVVGSTPGSRGTFFKTSVQLHNPSGAQISGRIAFHRTGVSGIDSDPVLAYVLSPGQTQSIADLLPAIGLSGLGSADVEVTAGSVPTMTARVFNDAGAAGTTGFTVEPMRAEDALSPGLSAPLLVPADFASYRFNIGVRTLADGATVTFVIRNAAGAEVGTSSRTFPPSYHEQASAVEFLRIPEIPPGGSIAISVTNGSAIFYGATVDNVTGDPSLQIARARGPWDL